MAQLLPDITAARILLSLVLIAGAFFFNDLAVPVLAALVICFASWPIYQRLLVLCRQRRALAASTAIAAIILGIIIPIGLVTSYALEEIRDWVEWLIVVSRQGAPAPVWIENLPGFGSWLAAQWNIYLSEPQSPGFIVSLLSRENLGGLSKWVLTFSGGALNLLLGTLFMLITLFFLYKDGAHLARQLDVVGERVLPARWQRFSRVVPATVSSTVIGMGLIAVGEGVVLGVAYWLAGVPTPIAMGAVTAFMALIPGGAPLTFTLVSLYLIGTGEPAAGVGLFIWGTVELFIVDKTLRPRLVGGPIKLPFLPTFSA